MQFSWKRTIPIGFGFVSIFVIWPVFNQFIPVFLQAGNAVSQEELRIAGRSVIGVQGFGLAPGLAFFIMTWDNILNVFVQPWVGAKSDTTWTRFGRRKPWLLAGVPLAALGFMLIPFANTVPTIMACIMVTNLGMALFRSPTAAWLGDLFPPEQRSKARGVTGFMAGVGAVLALVGSGILYERVGRPAPFVGSALLMLGTAAVALLLVKESRQVTSEAEEIEGGLLQTLHTMWRAEDRREAWLVLSIFLWFMIFTSLQAGASSFAVFTLGMSLGQATRTVAIFAVAVIVFAIPSGLIGTRFGRRRTIRAGLMGIMLSSGGGYLFIQEPVDFAVVLVLLGFFWSLIVINDLPLLYDVGDERRIGVYTGIYFVATESAAVLGPTLFGVLVGLANTHHIIFAFGAFFAFFAWLCTHRV